MKKIRLRLNFIIATMLIILSLMLIITDLSEALENNPEESSFRSLSQFIQKDQPLQKQGSTARADDLAEKRRIEERYRALLMSSSLIDPQEISMAKTTDMSISEDLTTSDDLSRFGRSFFSRETAENSPDALPVGPDYIVGPGDEVRVSIWGLEEGHFSLTVGRDGSLALPEAGAIGAAGLSFGQLQRAIEKAYAHYYNNMQTNVTMGRIHSIGIYVTGQAERPGYYTLPGTSSFIDGIIRAGGPSLAGSMRKVLLKRGTKVVATMDLYSLLLRGNRRSNVRLRQGDVVFFPPVGPLVGVTGSVKVPAVYELLKTPSSLSRVIEMAGGPTDSSFKDRVQISRINDSTFRTAFETSLMTGDRRLNTIPVRSGDMVRIFPVSDEPVTATIEGAIKNPGKFSIEPGRTTLMDLIKRSGGLREEASSRAELTRTEKTPLGPRTTRFTLDLGKMSTGLSPRTMRLQKHDFITIYAVPDWHLSETVRITGEVLYPGTYSIKKGEKLSSLIERAGGFTPDAFVEGSVFMRESVRVQQQKEYQKMLDRLQRDALSATAGAAALDNGAASSATAVSEQVKQLVTSLRAMKPIGRVVVKIPEKHTLLKESTYDIRMEKGDRLHVPERMSTINVMGAVYNPTAFVYRANQTYPYYLNKAGGYNVNADRKRVYIIRADGSATRGIVKKRHQVVKPGDTVIIPEKVLISTGMRQTSTIIDMIYKVAVAAAVVTD